MNATEAEKCLPMENTNMVRIIGKKCRFQRTQSGNYDSGITRVFESKKNFYQSVKSLYIGSAKLGNLKSRSI